MRFKTNYCGELPKEYKNLKKGAKLKINNKIYTVKNKSTHKDGDHINQAEILYDLGNDYWFNYHWDWKFFKMVEKKLLWGILGISRKAEYIPIKSIKILK